MLEVYLRHLMPRMPELPTRTDMMSQTSHGWSTLNDKDKHKRKLKNKAVKKSKIRNRKK